MIDKTYPITEKLLSNGLKLTQKLYELLTAEQAQLKQKTEPVVFSALAAQKKEVVLQLEQFTKHLAQVLATEKLTISQEGVICYLSKAKAANLNIAESSQYWLHITAISRKCRALNEQNGAGIDLLTRYTQRSLQVLRGKSQLATTYGPDGSTRSELFSHTLISV